MTRFRKMVAVILTLMIVGGITITVFVSRERERQRLDKIVHGTVAGAITYNCNGPVEVKLIADRNIGEPAVWSVQTSGSTPVRANSFIADTGSMGGSQGLRWKGSDGQQRTAIMSYSDIVGEYGPETIWFSSDRYDFICMPDPASFHRH
ncbi:hypothetical protein [Sphingomonas sp. NFR04]|uniref:hypothetical protein n=1 Tax=Sphingomonas sp. NFR04 TaxID=1566283 RepID=UPI0011145157|nr:hypothetical protein [Sphingomonas sp. NFR04]